MNDDWKDRLKDVATKGERLQGRVDRLRGSYFFVREYHDHGRQDYFAHKNDLTGMRIHEIERGDLVSFIPVLTDKGTKAEDVKLEICKHLIKGDDR